ncbi:MAG: thiamine pyrophosphate-binding protein [Candidatus Liptonbacteria bacterium]|nr:thiamine pyrophosphate-binding protein [Candidatus Liptonbacteria bacterium]
MKLTDYIAEFLAERGVRHVFSVTGGAIAHLVDSLGNREKAKGDIRYICVQHEQAGAMAAEVYSRIGPGIGVAIATSGPGATNLITGICGCYFDSIPGLFITGQVNTKESVESIETRPRQVGFQETDIVSIAKPITKYAAQVRDPSRIRFELEKAYYIAHEGRPGPVLIDVPLDVQVADIDPATLPAFDPRRDFHGTPQESDEDLKKKISEMGALVSEARRPAVLLGGGIKLANAEREALRFAEALGFPILVSWSAFDILPHDHPNYAGTIGVYGDRGANFTVQNADLLISVGSRLDTRQTGGRVDLFLREGKSVMVDIDPHELHKNRGFTPTIAVCADAKRFLNAALASIPQFKKPDIGAWLSRAREWKKKYHAVLPEHFQMPAVSAYAFIHALSDALPQDEIVITDEGGNLVWTMQGWIVKKGQRIISTFGNSPMGYAFPASIGAAFAAPGKDIICIDGDGGFQLNIQELQTVAHYNLPIKMFILNNRGMAIIKQFQEAYFENRRYATEPEGGYSMPDFARVSEAYGIPAIVVEKPAAVKDMIAKVLAHKGPILCDVRIDRDQKLNPKLEFGRPLEDMAPYLSDEELSQNILVKPVPRLAGKKGWQRLQ